MKFIVILFSFCVVVSAVKQELIKLPQEKLAKAQNMAKQCAAEHNVDPGLFPKIADGTLPRDEATNKFLYCFALKGGFIIADGHLVVDKIASLLGDHPLLEELKDALRKCNDVTNEDALATVAQVNSCMTTKAPVRFLFE